MLRNASAWTLILSFALLPQFAAAANVNNRSYKVCGRSYSDRSPFAWANVKVRYKKQLDARDVDAVKLSLLDELQASLKQKDEGLLGAFLTKAKAVIASKEACCSQFQIRKLEDEDFNSHMSLLEGTISLDDCGQNGEKGDQLDELRYVADDFYELGQLRIAPFQAKGVTAIREKNEEYDRMLFHGFPMFPWEALANSALLTDPDIAKGPPSNQLVLFHPSAGAEMQIGLRESKVAASLALEPIGWVRYPKAGKHRTWWGLSALTTFRNDMGIGLGAAARYENFMVGVLWHDSDDDKRPFNSKPFVFIGVDLYQFAGEKLRRYDGLKDRVTDTLKKEAALSPQ